MVHRHFAEVADGGTGFNSRRCAPRPHHELDLIVVFPPDRILRDSIRPRTAKLGPKSHSAEVVGLNLLTDRRHEEHLSKLHVRWQPGSMVSLSGDRMQTVLIEFPDSFVSEPGIADQGRTP